MLRLTLRGGEWQWCADDHFGGCPSDSTARAHLLAALLPRAIEKWVGDSRAEQVSTFDSLTPQHSWHYINKSTIPRTLEQAVCVLEGV